VGAKIQLTASARAVGPLEYKWWVFDGAAWVVLQEWSSNNKLFWMPPAANPNYKVMVRAQVASDTSVNGGASLSFPVSSTRK
jgi:hypothetical protein